MGPTGQVDFMDWHFVCRLIGRPFMVSSAQSRLRPESEDYFQGFVLG